MIKCNLSVLMGQRKLKISDVVRETGINRNTIHRLYYEKATRIDYDILDKLCDYFNCEVGDFLVLKQE
ncbi:hypothetical protein ACZ81_04380 [Alteromonas macleodii]|nr:helix-turn-helix transcriptional regulator [Alteromonas macleodii]AMN13746.1 hypothetical protein ACZ81_04380 [Alteromonas macleodii]